MFSWMKSVIWGSGNSQNDADDDADEANNVTVRGIFAYKSFETNNEWRVIYSRGEIEVLNLGQHQFNLVITRSEDDPQENGDAERRRTRVFPISTALFLANEFNTRRQTPYLTWRERAGATHNITVYNFTPDDIEIAKYNIMFIERLALALYETDTGAPYSGSNPKELLGLLVPATALPAQTLGGGGGSIGPNTGNPTLSSATPMKEAGRSRSNLAAAAAASEEVINPNGDGDDGSTSGSHIYPTFNDDNNNFVPPRQQQQQQQQPSAADVRAAPIPAASFHTVYGKNVGRQGGAGAGAAPPTAVVPLEGLDGKTLVRVAGKLYLFNEETEKFVAHNEHVEIAILEVGEFRFELIVIADSGVIVVRQGISHEIFPFFDMENRSIIWMYQLNTCVWTWSVVFDRPEDDLRFKDIFAKKLYETTKGEPFDAVPEEDKKMILATMDEKATNNTSTIFDPKDDLTDDDLRRFTAIDLSDSEEDDDDDDEEEEYEDDEEDDEDEEDEGDDDDDDDADKNSLLAVAHKRDRAFVVRGSQIGVFGATAKNKLRFKTRISSIRAPKSKEKFSPTQVMLHDSEGSLLMLHPEDSRKVFRMDLTRGQVVDEWNADVSWPVNELFPAQKYGEQTPEATFCGLNRKGFFVLDPRLPGNKMVQDRAFFSKAVRAPGFCCVATTGAKQVVAGTEKGEIKFYDHRYLDLSESRGALSEKPIAKNNYPGFGDAPIAIDVTNDGKWTLVTCKTYLLVIPSVDADGRSAFSTRLGKEKEYPRRLQIRPEHVALMGGSVSFTPARFDTGDGARHTEKTIVTSSGPYFVVWNFRKVKQNQLNFYQITKLNGDIVADQFRFDDPDSVIVAMQDDVIITRKEDKKGSK